MENITRSLKHLPPVGQRIVRSVISIALCFVVYIIRGRTGIPFYSAIAALQCIQPYQESMLKTARNRIIGTMVGAFWGLLVLLAEVNFLDRMHVGSFTGYMLISIAVGVVIYSTVLLGIKETAYFSGVVFMCITVNHMTDSNPYIFVMNRIVDTLIGVAVACIVNSAHLPRRKRNDVLFVSGIDHTLLDAGSRLSDFSRIELNRMILSGANFTFSTARTPASVREAVKGVSLRLPIIAMDGAVFYDMTENSYLRTCPMPPAAAARLADFLRAEKLSFFTDTITEDLLVIYYDTMANPAIAGHFNKCRNSPYRNYVRSREQAVENVVYFYVIDETRRIEEVYAKLKAMPWASDYRIVKADYPGMEGYAQIKCYDKDTSRDNMLKKLSSYLDADKVITLGSTPGHCDILIDTAKRDDMVKKLKKLYEPVIWSKS